MMTANKISFKLRNRLQETEKLGRLLERFADDTGLSRKDMTRINLVIEELFTNIIKYGHGDGRLHWVDISMVLENGQITIRIEDDGIPFDPASREAPDTRCPVEKRPIGGLGIHLCRGLMDDIAYERHGAKNIVTMKKKVTR